MITSKSGKAFGANPISMGGLRFASPPVKPKSKRVTAKKVVPDGDPVVAEVLESENAVTQVAATQEPADQARAA